MEEPTETPPMKEEQETEESQPPPQQEDTTTMRDNKNTDDRMEQQRIIDTTTQMLEEQEKTFGSVETSQSGLRDTMKKAIADIRRAKEELQRGPQQETDEQGNEEEIMTEAESLFNDICGRASQIDNILRETDTALNNTVNLVAEGTKEIQ